MVVDARSPAQPQSAPMTRPMTVDARLSAMVNKGVVAVPAPGHQSMSWPPARTAGRPFDGDMVEHCGCFTDYVGLLALGQCPHQGWKNTHRVEPIDTTGMPTLASAESSCWSKSIDTKTVEGKGNRHRMEFPEPSAKADLPILIVPRMQ